MRLRALGMISIEDENGRVHPVVAPRPRRILAMLESRAGTVVSEQSLIEGIWGDEAPESARTALQTYVSALRDLLEPQRRRRTPGQFIAREGDGYALHVEDASFDIAGFENSFNLAAKVHGDDPIEAVRLLDEALALWADPPFGEFADEPWAIGSVTRLRDLHAAVLESRFGLALDDGTEESLLDRMEAATEAYPYRERLTGQMMLALYRRGEQEHALALYSRTRARLVEDLGLDPGRELQLLERAILAQDPALRTRGEQDPENTARRHLSVPAPRPLVGRDEEIGDVARMVRSERCVTILGPGGVGKSALAASVVSEVAAGFGSRIYHVDLADLAGRDVLRSIGSAMRIVEHPLAPLADSVTDAIDDEPSLLVLETCEVAVESVASAITALLRAPALRVLMTSQVPLRVSVERVFRLGPLSLDAAVEFLTPTGEADEADAASLRGIAERLEFLPLPLELAASRVAALGPAELLRQLSTSMDLLTGAADRPLRHRSARATTEWSLGLVDSAGRELMFRLAAFNAPFTIDAAIQLGADPTAVGELAGDLVDRSLLVRLAGRPSRFRMLDTVRSVALELAGPEVRESARTLLAEIVLLSAQQSALGLSPSVGMHALEGELVPALDWFAERNDERQLTLAASLPATFTEQARISEGREQLAEALAAHPGALTEIRIVAAAQLGFLAWYQGDLGETRAILGDIVGMLDQVQLPGFAATVGGCSAFMEHRYEDSADLLAQAADEASGNAKQQLLVVSMAGNASWYAGNLRAAAGWYRRQRDMAQASDDRFNIAQALRFEAMVTAQLGDIEAAWRWAERSLAMSHEMADTVSLAQSFAASAAVARIAEARPDALHHAVDALVASQRHFDVFSLRTAIPIVAEAATQAGDHERAAHALGWYLDLLEQTGQTASPASEAVAEATLSSVREKLGAAGFARASAQGAVGGLRDLIEAARD